MHCFLDDASSKEVNASGTTSPQKLPDCRGSVNIPIAKSLWFSNMELCKHPGEHLLGSYDFHDADNTDETVESIYNVTWNVTEIGKFWINIKSRAVLKKSKTVVLHILQHVTWCLWCFQLFSISFDKTIIISHTHRN